MRSLLTIFMIMLLLPLAGFPGDAAKPAKAASVAGPARDEVLPIPGNIASGSTVELQCGRIYSGTLDLSGKSDITVRTKGDCGPARLSPGRPVSGWERWRGNIYSAPVTFHPAHMTVDEKVAELAHYPNRPQIWAKGKGLGPDRLRHVMPEQDLTGALLMFRGADWTIETRPVIGYKDGVISVQPGSQEIFGFHEVSEFYVEGKLWMLDSPGEWAYSNGRVYLWPPDGKSPEGRVWASPAENGIAANHSSNITVEAVEIFTANHGIAALSSRNFRVRNARIINSLQDGVHAGGEGLLVDGVTIENSGKNGIWVYYGSTRSVIKNSTILSTGMVGMPKRSKGGIVFEQATDQQVLNNKVINSSYIGIRVHRDAVVSGNLVDGACLILTDCGGIYTFARDKQPLNVRIEGNTIRNLAQRWSYAIYLDDFANGVTVRRNIISGNPSGMQLHNGFNNEIVNNVFAGSKYQHILMNETDRAPSIRNNKFSQNIFLAAGGIPVYRLWSSLGGRTVRKFGDFDGNVYAGADSHFAEVAGTGMVSYARWRSLMQQDGRSSTRSAMLVKNEDALRAMLEMLPAGRGGSSR